MPFLRNPFMAGNIIWECQYCGEVFMFVDDGEEHEKECRKNPINFIHSGVIMSERDYELLVDLVERSFVAKKHPKYNEKNMKNYIQEQIRDFAMRYGLDPNKVFGVTEEREFIYR